jgi:hypothetical protein
MSTVRLIINFHLDEMEPRHLGIANTLES